MHDRKMETGEVKKQNEFVRVGLIYKIHGVRGEVLVLPLTSDIRRFERLREVYLEGKDGLPFSLPKLFDTAGSAYQSGESMNDVFVIDYAKFHKEKVLLKITGVDNADTASLLKGQYLTVAPDQLITLAPDTFFIFDLIGCSVYNQDDGACLGELTDVLETGSNDIYVVKNPQTKIEMLIPALKSVVKEVRTEEKKIIVDWHEEK